MQVTKIYGPPGTGKTTELMRRMEGSGLPHSRIGFFAFTKAAAKEARERLHATRNERMTTLHALCYHEIHMQRGQVFDADDLAAFAQETGIPCEGKQSFGSESVAPGDTALEAIHRARASMRPLVDIPSEESYEFIRYVSEQYALFKERRGLLDFDDMLDRFLDSHDGDLRVEELYIDEGQDLSPHQWAVVRHVAQHAPRLLLAGDDDQAIYPWAGADPLGMTHWTGEDLVLGQSWRIPRRVHDIAHGILERIPNRVEKAYLPRPDEGEVRTYGDWLYCPKVEGSVLILFRNHSSRQDVVDWLTIERPVPFLGEGSPFQGRWAVAVRNWLRLKGGREVDKAQLQAIGWCSPEIRKRIEVGDMAWLRFDPFDALGGMPEVVRWYLRHVDLEATPTVRISTIHAAKGAEADRVILHMGMGERTWAEAGEDEHRVWYVGVTRARKVLDLIDGPNAYPVER